jgi:hypothetical protein
VSGADAVTIHGQKLRRKETSRLRTRRPPRIYRQGDLLLFETEAPAESSSVASGERLVLLEGEATGHAHTVSDPRAELRGATSSERLLSLREARALYLLVHGGAPIALEHDEHDTLQIEPGCYRVVRQREYQPDAAPRYVSD